MDRYIETFDSWNRMASQYEDQFMELNLYDHSYQLIISSIKKANAKILEIGCGPGNISKYLLSRLSNLEIHGIDIAPKMVELAKKNNPSAHYEIMDARNINELSVKYDAIIGGFCLPYLSQKDSEKLIVDSLNLLHKNGLLYLSFIEGDENKSGYQTGSTNNRCYVYYHHLEKLENHLLNTGFERLKISKVDYTRSSGETEIHTIVIAKKK